jgi:hypothetical protein
VDEIQSADPNKRTRFVNIRIQGTPEDYKITMRKNRDKWQITNDKWQVTILGRVCDFII